ncbi:MAG: FtsH protease activity modulator HflK [Spirochaetaceae bacterium]|jgi:membrane protease subunit HflK|nr:FtsH protease activity modulator HflK [Spirochaetaceae bacterium]
MEEKNVTPGRAKTELGKFLKPATIIIVIVALAIITMLATSVYIVDQTEKAVITRFGKYHNTTGAGIHVRLPFGIDNVYLVNVTTVQTEQFGFRTISSGINSSYVKNTNESTMLTGDLNIIEVEWIIQYRIIDPVAWTFNVNEREKTIRDVSQSAINMLIGDRAIMDIMGTERSAIESEGAEFMNDTFRIYGLGIDVIAVRMQNIDPPAGVQAAFDDVNKAEQDMNRLINEGQQAYNEQIPKTRGEAEQLVQEAQGYATERVNRARGDVARFLSVLEEYRSAPQVTRERLYVETMEEVFTGSETQGAGGSTTIIDRNFQNYLPIQQLGNGGTR